MTIQTMLLDPNATSYTDDQIVGKINTATATISRAGCVLAGARPLVSAECTVSIIAVGAVNSVALASGVAKTNLDAMSDITRGYIKTNPTVGEFRVVSIQRGTVASGAKLDTDYDDVAIT